MADGGLRKFAGHVVLRHNQRQALLVDQQMRDQDLEQE